MGNLLIAVVLALLVVAVVGVVVVRNRGKRNNIGGGLTVGEYSPGTPAVDIALAELKNACTFYEKRRNQAKYRAENVLVGTRVANGCIAVIGVLVTFEGWSRWGIVSTALAAVVAGIAEWDTHYRHRELWIQRTVVLSKLQHLLRDARYRLARQPQDGDAIADDVIARLGAILDDDLRNWTAMRGDTEDPPQDEKHSPGPHDEEAGESDAAPRGDSDDTPPSSGD